MLEVVKKFVFSSKKVVFRVGFGSKKVVFHFSQPNNHGGYRTLPIERFHNIKQLRSFLRFNRLIFRQKEKQNEKQEKRKKKKRTKQELRAV